MVDPAVVPNVPAVRLFDGYLAGQAVVEHPPDIVEPDEVGHLRSDRRLQISRVVFHLEDLLQLDSDAPGRIGGTRGIPCPGLIS